MNRLCGPIGVNGIIPDSISDASQLIILDLGSNSFSGPIPTTLGNLRNLRQLILHSNKLTRDSSTQELSFLSSLTRLILSNNPLNGTLPVSIGNFSALERFLVDNCSIKGSIPNEVWSLSDLATLSLEDNELTGSVPTAIGQMRMLQVLHLDSTAPFQTILEGEIPNEGSFANLSAGSFLGNSKLCGAPQFQVLPCKASTRQGLKRSVSKPIIYILSAIVLTVLVLELIFLLFRSQKKKSKPLDKEDMPALSTWRRISYQELGHATSGFDESCLLGKGGFGSVYKGKLLDGMIIAVKVFHLQVQRALRIFNDESLVLEYLATGSLEKWLHSHNHFLDVLQRLNILIDVASALEYLHHGYGTLIVHCDLKPNNILLGEGMVACVGDFGIAKLLGEQDSMTQTHTFATIGCMAPEYGLEGIVSARGDVYSFGILMMESFTRKKPTDNMFYLIQ
ncbi:hypothetical protein Ddye_024247 [Dipteronia dyeriana]|uniref:Protein kinase domain-containing protein n=1 Tax=Dipteronia dyeriana TaxID=168575 RepID=A0AAD9TVE6_9ROSI|nr:hypothetical protein Ddye_024247 [Dipteronia dyeriana]